MRRKIRRWVLLAALGLAGFLVAWVAADYLTAPRLLAGPMIQQLRPDGFAVVWWIHPDRPGRLLVRGADGFVASIEAVRQDGQWFARVGGLQPAASYRYELTCKGLFGWWHRVARARIQTAKPPGRPLRFIAFGDSGTGDGRQMALSAVMARHEPDLVIHTGDLIYMDGAYEDYPAKFFVPYAGLIRSVPFYPALGNHDWRTDRGEPMLRRFVLPRNGPDGVQPERCYWFDYGDARFVAIDSNLASGTLQRDVAPWLKRVLGDCPARWRFVFFHHPPYTGGRHPPDERIQAALVPALERCGVDVVFCGHNHLYERTYPMRAGRVVPDGRGVVYVTTGAGGMRLYAERQPPPAYIAAYHDAGFSFTLVEIDGPRLRLRQIDEQNATVDEWIMTKSTAGKAGSAASIGPAGR